MEEKGETASRIVTNEGDLVERMRIEEDSDGSSCKCDARKQRSESTKAPRNTLWTAICRGVRTGGKTRDKEREMNTRR